MAEKWLQTRPQEGGNLTKSILMPSDVKFLSCVRGHQPGSPMGLSSSSEIILAKAQSPVAGSMHQTLTMDHSDHSNNNQNKS